MTNSPPPPAPAPEDQPPGTSRARGPLAGIRVLEVASYIAGPYGGSLLADLGAEVIKIENPDGGDPFRGWQRGGANQIAFWSYNRSKKSVILNLREEAGRVVLRRLVSSSDVLLENMRPGVMDRLGVGYEQLSELQPRLIYCSVTGFGQHGPYAMRPAYDGVGQALSGMVSQLTDLASPTILGPNFSDSLAGSFAAYGVLGALVARERTGLGQRVDTSLVGATLSFLVAPATDALAGNPPSGPRQRPISSQTYAWTAQDGLPFTVHLSSPPKFWEGLARSVGRPELIDDPRYRTQIDRRDHYDELHDELAPIFLTKRREDWLAILIAADVPCAPIYNLREVFDDPQVQDMGLQVSMPRGSGGEPIKTVGCAVEFSETPVPLPSAPPELGEHTESVLAQVGYGAEEIDDLRARGILGLSSSD